MDLLTCISVLSIFVLAITLGELFKPADRKLRLFGQKRRLPPGPEGLPVVGNLHDFSQARDSGNFIPYLKLLGQYGEMTTLRLGSRTWVLLNSHRVISEIIVKNGKITGERPYMPIASGLVSNDKRSVIRQTAQWQEGRRVMHYLLSGSSLGVYGDWYETESIRLLLAHLQNPKQWHSHHFRYATSVLYRLVLGEPFEKSKKELDEFQQTAMEFIWSLNRHFVDFFPWLAQLPSILHFWSPRWKRMGASHRRVIMDWWTPVAARVSAGIASPSFVRDTLLHPETKYQGDREEAMYLANSIMSAGGDNTRMALNTFFMAMISYPQAFDRLQNELDKHCCIDGKLALPTLQDMPSLPYCTAIVKEVLRWRPTVPVSPPHHLTETLSFDEYVFPPGTDFVINNIALHQDSTWKEADKFRPERYMDGNESNPTHNFWGFGGGRRICVGYRVAQQSLFVAFARMAFCFRITADGEFNDWDLKPRSLTEPFPVKLEPRSEAHRRLILEEAVSCNIG